MFDQKISFEGEYASIPQKMQDSILAYVFDHVPVGSFLEAVICNDLRGAVGRADAENLPLLKLYVQWFFNVCPQLCVGAENYKVHLKNKKETVLKVV